MPKTPRLFDASDYVPVAERIAAFYEQNPNGRIVTRLVERTTSIVIVRASAYRSHTDQGPSATGWAAERPGYGEINTVACLENAETSAVGRALANLGLHAARRTPAAADRTATASAAANDRRPASAQSLGIATIYEAPVFHSVPPAAPATAMSSCPSSKTPPCSPAASANPPTWCPRRCTRSPTVATVR